MYTPEQTAFFQAYINAGHSQEVAMQALQQAMAQQAAVPAPVAAPVAQLAPLVTAIAQQVAQQPVGYAAPVDPMAMFAAIAAVAAESEDHSAISSGKPPREGIAWIRIKSYIELGVHQGKNTTYAAKPIAMLVLELHHPDHMVTFEGKTEPKEITIRISKTSSQQSKFPKLFKSLQRAIGMQYTNLSQMIGQCCLGTIVHNKDGEKTYANFDMDGNWTFQAASGFNNDGTQYTVNIPPLHGTPRLFMMDNQKIMQQPQMVKQMWDSVHIAGTRESTDASGTKQTISNNYFQELIAKSQLWGTSETKRILDSQGCVTGFGDAYVEVQADPAAATLNMGAQVNASAPQAIPQAAAYQAPQAAPQPVQPVQQAVPQAVPQPALHMPQPVQQPALHVPQAAALPAMVIQPTMQMNAAAFMNTLGK